MCMDNIVGQQVGIFQVLAVCDHKDNDGHKLYRVKCVKCGCELHLRKHNIQRVKTCRHVDARGQKKLSTKWNNKRLQRIFYSMKRRCYSPGNKSYAAYGGRGIQICEEWLSDPKRFEEWAIAHGYDDHMTIDRVSADHNYEPENCRWVSFRDNATYRRNTHVIYVDGVGRTGKDWARVCCVGENVVNKMIAKRGLAETILFIRARLKYPDVCRQSHLQSWFDAYNEYIDIERRHSIGLSTTVS